LRLSNVVTVWHERASWLRRRRPAQRNRCGPAPVRQDGKPDRARRGDAKRPGQSVCNPRARQLRDGALPPRLTKPSCRLHSQTSHRQPRRRPIRINRRRDERGRCPAASRRSALPGLFQDRGHSRLVRIRPPDSHKAGKDTQDVAGPLRPSSPAGVTNITHHRLVA
jgi:hypothetical protein